jgi:hypothetical protein
MKFHEISLQEISSPDFRPSIGYVEGQTSRGRGAAPRGGCVKGRGFASRGCVEGLRRGYVEGTSRAGRESSLRCDQPQIYTFRHNFLPLKNKHIMSSKCTQKSIHIMSMVLQLLDVTMTDCANIVYYGRAAH